jgi:hypothetical protein
MSHEAWCARCESAAPRCSSSQSMRSPLRPPLSATVRSDGPLPDDRVGRSEGGVPGLRPGDSPVVLGATPLEEHRPRELRSAEVRSAFHQV